MDCDGTRANDIQLAVSHFKFSGSTLSQAALLDFTLKNIWEEDENRGGFASIENISTSVVGSKLTMSVYRAVYDRYQDEPVYIVTFKSSITKLSFSWDSEIKKIMQSLQVPYDLFVIAHGGDYKPLSKKVIKASRKII